MHRPSRFKKGLTTFMVLLLAAQTLAGSLYPQTARAIPVEDIPAFALNLSGQILNRLKDFLLQAAVVVAVNLGQAIARNVAENVATQLATGNAGEKPLFPTETLDQYISEVKDAAMGEFLLALGEGLGLGNYLCRPVPPDILVGLQLATLPILKQKDFGLVAQCTWSKAIDNWKQMAAIFDPEQFYVFYQQSFQPGRNDINEAQGTVLAAYLNQLAAAEKAREERQAQETFLPVKDPVTGQVKTPSILVAEEAKGTTVREERRRQDTITAGLLASGAESIGAVFANTFVSTFVTKLANRILKKGIAPTPTGGTTIDFGAFAGSPYTATEAVKAAYSDLFTPTIVDAGNLDLLSDFLSCPDKFPQVNNCVIDSKFETAVRSAQNGTPKTVAEAIAAGNLHGEWHLINPGNASKNAAKTCRKEAYCYSNLQKLRKARVLPIGFEIASLASPIDTPVTLQEVVNHFNDCGLDNNGKAKADDAHPYCHLIDPNWVLKMPPTQCRAKVFGPVLESSESNTRQEYCADTPSCVAEDESGNCLGAWGYCVREKNVWRLAGDTCPAHLNTCTTFKKRVGGDTSLLLNTVDFGVCNEKNVGCREYRAPDATGAYAAGAAYFFNAKVAACSPQNAGCSRLMRADGSPQHLKIPSSGLNCTGEDTDPAECGKYAPVCYANEIGCELYTPAGNDPAVPGIYTPAERNPDGTVKVVGASALWHDECDASCAGYGAFTQDATVFEPQTTLTYFIPQTAKECSAASVGCDSFTNVDAAAAGVEGVEYYSKLRLCKKPNAPGIAHSTYYYWEGSEQSGYQLKSVELQQGPALPYEEQISITVDAQQMNTLIVEYGGKPPLYDTGDAAKIKEYKLACNQYRYQNRNNPSLIPPFDPDCKELFDVNGKISYRLLAKTIIVSDSCVQFRKTSSTEVNCAATGGTWNVAGSACIYDALPTASASCPTLEAGCRAYRGNAANTTKNVIYDDFVAINGWSAGTLSSESLSVGEASLKLTSAYTEKDVKLEANIPYTVSFWAKGTGTLTASLIEKTENGAVAATHAFAQTAGLTGDWRLYTLGPLALTQTPSVTSTLHFSGAPANTAAKPAFIDKILLKAAVDNFFVVKNSWKTPTQCDANPNDGLPGVALGCTEYTDRFNKKAYLTGFTTVCREKAVGCKLFVNTQNSAAAGPQTWNDGDGEVNVPADAIEFYVDDQKYYCPAETAGCTLFGQVVATTTEPAYLLNAPDKYDTTLCKATETGCDSFTAGAQQYYFKDPASLGKTCEYLQDVAVSPAPGTPAITTSGWFRKDESGATVPCYEDNLLANNTYGIWKNGDAPFTGYTGVCPAEQNKCTEFVDRADKSVADGKPYYYLDNEKLDRASCKGAAQKAGCVLFDNTSILKKDWNTAITYKKSNEAGGVEVTPVAGGAGAGANDANTLLKVTRDRACSEWLACQSAVSVFDPQVGYREVCTSVGLCNEYKSAKEAVSQCSSWVVDEEVSNKKLDRDVYSKRDVTWYGEDFTGYAFYNSYQPTDLTFVKIGEKSVLAYVSPPASVNGVAGIQCTDGFSCTNDNNDKGVCAGSACAAPPNNFLYNADSQGLIGPSCRGYPEAASPFPASVVAPDGWTKYGEMIKFASGAFARANVCQLEGPYGGSQNCECSYTKVTFGQNAKMRFYSSQTASTPSGVCQGGVALDGTSKEGKPCDAKVQCKDERKDSEGNPIGEDGICVFRTREDQVFGWDGYCLERDLSTPVNGSTAQRACLSWYPVDLAFGSLDIYNLYKTAGYVPPEGSGRYYCLQSAGRLNTATSPYSYEYKNTGKICGRTHSYNSSNNFPTTIECNGKVVTGYPFDSNQTVNGTFDDGTKVQVGTYKGSISYPASTIDFEGNGTAASKNIYLEEIDYIRVTFLNNGETNWPNKDSKVWLVNNGQWRYYNGKSGNKEAINIVKTWFQDQPIKLVDTGGEEGTNINGYSGNNGDGLSGFKQDAKDGDYLFFRWRDNQDNPSFNGLTSRLKEQGGCNGGSGHIDLYSLEVVFDPTTHLLKSVDTNVCDAGDGESVDVKVDFFLRDACNAVVTVDAAGVNKAATDAVWKSPNLGYPHPPVNFELTGIGPNPTLLLPETITTPFGSLSIMKVPPNRGVFTYAASDAAIGDDRIASGRILDQGFAMSCKDGACAENLPTPSTRKYTTAKEANDAMFRQLFAAIYEFWTIDTSKLNEETNSAFGYTLNIPKPTDGVPSDSSGVPGYEARAPRVYPVPSTCSPGTGCSWGTHPGFTVSATSTGTVFGVKNLPTTASFFGYADRNHMPVKRVRIDWNDGTTKMENEGKYKNEKPYCSSGEKPAAMCEYGSGLNPRDPNLTCKQDSDCPVNDAGVQGVCGGEQSKLYWSFGNDPGACTDGFFAYAHSYAYKEDCGADADGTPITAAQQEVGDPKNVGNYPKKLIIDSDAKLAEVNAAYGTAGKVKLNDTLCVYKPRVQLLDNWDWCNGVVGGTDMTPKGYHNDAPWNLADKQANACEHPGKTAYTSFGGYIIIKK